MSDAYQVRLKYWNGKMLSLALLADLRGVFFKFEKICSA